MPKSKAEFKRRVYMISIGAAYWSNGKDEESLIETWMTRTAIQAVEILGQSDVKVTNKKDKKIQLPKLLELVERLKDMDVIVPAWSDAVADAVADAASSASEDSEPESSHEEESVEPDAKTEALKVGDRVRIKKSVKEPKYGWGSVTHDLVPTPPAPVPLLAKNN